MPYTRRPDGWLSPKELRKDGRTMKYVCDLCGWEYDEAAGFEDAGIAPGTPWSEVADDFECPLCGAGKDQLSEDE